MGIIISKFKKNESTKDKLKKIQEKIDQLEEYKQCTEQTGKKLVGSLVIYSFIICLIAAVIYYFYYLPTNFNDRLLYATPFIVFIILVYLMKRILTWYYRWKVGRNEKNLANLKAKKTDILDQVMETETYKVAKDILETFAPEQLRKNLLIRTPGATPMTGQRMSLSQGVELRQRITSATPLASQQGFSVGPALATNNHGFVRPLQASPKSSTPFVRPHFTSTPRNVAEPSLSYSSKTPLNGNGNMDTSLPPGPPMPRPILPRERGILDRFVEYLVGDGPSNRYALVCRQCESHNGMALKEEFPYIAFRCAYCYYWNPARKQKPAPPKLETLSNTQLEKTLQKEGDEVELSSELEDEEELASSACECNTGSSSKFSSSDEEYEVGGISGIHLKNLLFDEGNSQKLSISTTEKDVLPEDGRVSPLKIPQLDSSSESLSNKSTPIDAHIPSSSSDKDSQETLSLQSKKELDLANEKTEASSDSQT